MLTICINDDQLLPLVAALDARERYLAGIAQRQLEYKATETRNKKLEAIEKERWIIEGLKHRIIGESILQSRNRSIVEPAAAPAQNESEQ
ncbi:MAG: hypothetical protein LCH81_03605 [Bacteroidetes bacterium]|nr:hypothetical protein [Bacteroidota bacterium]